MRALLRQLNPISYPIWLKIGIVIALLMAFVGGLGWTLWENLRRVDEAKLQEYLVEEGAARVTAIATVLRDAQNTVRDYVEDPVYSRQLLRLLLAGTPTTPELGTITPQELNSLLESTLFASGLYASVRVIDLDGQLRAGFGGGYSDTLLGQSESDNPAFLAMQTTLVGRTEPRFTIWDRGIPTIAYGSVVRLPDDTPVGFVITTVNVRDRIVPILQGDTNADAYVETFSYLITESRDSDGLVVFSGRRGGALERALASSATFEVESVLQGERPQNSTARYTYQVNSAAEQNSEAVQSEQAANVEVFGYYRPILDTELFFILETPTTSTLNVTLNGLTGGSFFFVLLIGLAGSALVFTLLIRQLVEPLNSLREAMRAVSSNKFEGEVAAAQRGDEIGQVALAFVEMREQIKGLIATLESRVEARGRDVATTQEISRFAATQRDIQTLMDRVVELIVTRFPNIYHAQIFLIDQDREYAVLRSSTGEPGKRLLERGHRLAVGSQSVIGRVSEEGQAVIARDTFTSGVHRRNEFLPDTRSELAIPLRVGSTVIGALDVQSKKSDSFTEDELNVLQTMADQIAIAIENANLYQESVRALEEIERTKRSATQRDWQEYLNLERIFEMTSERGLKTDLDTLDLRQRAMTEKRAVVGDPTQRNTVGVALPIMLRGQVLGAVELEMPLTDFGEDKVLLAQELVNRLGVSMENARLFQQSQLATERERLVNSITARLTAKNDINDILQTALREVGTALKSPEVTIRLGGWAGDTVPLGEDLATAVARVTGKLPPREGGNGAANGHENGTDKH